MDIASYLNLSTQDAEIIDPDIVTNRNLSLLTVNGTLIRD
jgi:hypothetical protein